MSISALLSAADGSDVETDLRADERLKIGDDELLWVDAVGPSDEDLATIADALGLDEDVAAALRRELPEPDLLVLDQAVEVDLLWLDDATGTRPQHMQVIAGDGWVITRHGEPLERLEEQRRRITDQREIGLLKPTEFLLSVLDWHIDGFHLAAEELERQVDRLDELALRRDNADLLPRLVEMRRRIATIRRIAASHYEAYHELARPDLGSKLDRVDREHVQRVTDGLERAIATIAQVREQLIGVFDVHMTRTAQRTNDIMRVLTVTSVVLLPAVVVAGVMGMNFRQQFFENPGLFWLVIGFMVLMAITTVVLARWRRWL